MKISDFIFQYPTHNVNDGLCRVRLFIKESSIYALLTDIGNYNPSLSVTNSIEIIIAELLQRGLVPRTTMFIEHYYSSSYCSNTFDIVEIKEKYNPIWKSISNSMALKLLGCDETELTSSIKTNSRLISEIDRIRYKMNPSMNFPMNDSSELIIRIEDINKGKKSKRELEKLVEENAKEQDIAKLLKEDLTFLAEVYAHPKDEYIIFSEFPFSEGFVDFVIFTGRSRMDVYLIEIKGANFNLLNSNGDFNKQIENASRQIDTRLGNYHRRYEEFRQMFHRVRQDVENGEQRYNSFLGPRSKLLVDFNKDVNIHTVIIGGRTNDDYVESKRRQDFEYNKNIKIKLETWDSWIRKLSRQ